MQTTSPRDLVRHELAQRRESGFDVAAVAPDLEVLVADPRTSDAALMGAYRGLVATTRLPSWNYVEPDELDDIVATLPPDGDPRVDIGSQELSDRVHGAWLGRVIGCNLGKPIEWGDHWTRAHIRDYLELANAYPLADYIPVLDPLPDAFDLHESWPETTLGNIDGSARDDDIDYAMLGLHLIETHGDELRAEHVADAWLTRLPYLSTCSAERATYRNLVNFVPVAEAGGVDNPFREWIGAQIRGDIFGYMHPGRPRRAAIASYQDASLSHRGNGIYGEMWAAALVSAAFVAADAHAAIEESLQHIPPGSRLHEAVLGVVGDWEQDMSWESALERVADRHGHYNWVHTVNNASVLTAGLLWADGDFSWAICLTVMGGLDTDSNGATAGSVAGILAGRNAIPEHWSAPLHDEIRSSLAGYDGARISDLAERTLRVLALGTLG